MTTIMQMMRNGGYDDDAQLATSLGYTSGGTPVTTEQLGFVYDPGWNLTNRAVNGAGTTYGVDVRNQLTAIGSASYGYDANGNLTTETGGSGRAFTYDDENRLLTVQWGAGNYRTEFAYDSLSRMRKRTEKYYTAGNWTVIGETRYIYDGMRVVQERNSSNVPTVTYTRGKDLSGSLGGAGGIGGLLARSHGYSGGTWTTHNFYHADGLGNVTYMISSAQAMVATYKYDPYGRTISSSGSLAGANIYRFSSKEWIYDGGTGYYYFGYRFYDAGLQRWLNRDPIGEWGGINVHSFVRNMPTTHVDPDGKFAWIPILKFGLTALGVEVLIDKGANAAYRSNAMLNATHGYQDAITRLNCKYGQGNWPEEVEDFMAQWQKELMQEFRPTVGAIAEGVPGSSITGPAENPSRL